MNISASKKNIVSGFVYLSLFLLITMIIFLFASFDSVLSSSQSDFVVNVLNGILLFFNIHLDAIQLDIFALVVRKLIGHFFIFFLDGLFAYLALIKLLKFKKQWLNFLIAAVVMFAVAGFSELIQFFASGRSAEWLDIGIDFAGAFFGILFVFLFTLMAKEKAKKISA